MKRKGNNLFKKIATFLLCLLFVMPMFAFVACGDTSGSGGGGGGSGGGSGGGGGFGGLGGGGSYSDMAEKGMEELTVDHGVALKYLYKPKDLSPYYPLIKAGIWNSTENVIKNLVGEYGFGDPVNVYNEEYYSPATLTASVTPFVATSSSTLSGLFGGANVTDTMKKNLSKAGDAYYSDTLKWFAIGPKPEIPENGLKHEFIEKNGSAYKINASGSLVDIITNTGVADFTNVPADSIYSLTTGGSVYYIWLGNKTEQIATLPEAFVEKLLDTHANAINRTITSVENNGGAIKINISAWAWNYEEEYTGEFVDAYMAKYKNKMAANIAKIIAFGSKELTGNALLSYNAVMTTPSDVNAEEFIDMCIKRIDHINVSYDEAGLITEYILNEVIGESIVAQDNTRFTFVPASQEQKYEDELFHANEVSDGQKRPLLIVDEDEYTYEFNGTILPDIPTVYDSELGFKRSALFKNYYNTVRTSIERTRKVYPEIPIVDYVDVAYGTGDEDVFDVTYEDPVNGKIQSIVVTNTSTKNLQLAGFNFMITSIHDEEHAKWTVDTLDIYVYVNYYHHTTGKFSSSVDTIYLSKDDPNEENGIDSDYGTLVEKNYNIYDVDDAPTLNGRELVIEKNVNEYLKTNVWGGLKEGNADQFDLKNSITAGTFRNFRSINHGVGNSAAYNGGGDYIEFCFVVDGKDATLDDYYNYSISLTAIYGKNV